MSAPFTVPSFDDDDDTTTQPTTTDSTLPVGGDCDGPASTRPDDIAAHMDGQLVPPAMRTLINDALAAEAERESAAPATDGEGQELANGPGAGAPAAGKGVSVTPASHVVPTGQGKNARVLPGDKKYPFCFVCASRHGFGQCEREETLFEDESD